MTPIEVLEKAHKEIKDKVRYKTNEIKTLEEALLGAKNDLEDAQMKAQEIAAAIVALRAV